MPVQHAKKIDFAYLNRKHVAFLCSQITPEISKIESELKEKGYQVWTGTNSAELYAHIGNETVGFIILGLDLGVEKLNQIGGFLIRKFKCPIFFFNRDKTPTPIESLKSPPETDMIDNLDLSAFENELRIFDFKYENRLREIYNFPLISESDFFNVVKTLPTDESSNILSTMKEVIKENSDFIISDKHKEYQIYKLLCPNENGYFIFAFPPENAPGSIEKAVATLNNQLNKASSDSQILEPLDQKFKADVYKSLTAHSEKTIVGFVEEQEMILSYFNLPSGSMPDSDIEEFADRMMIGIEDWWTEIPLNFNAYLWLEKNNHKFIYVKKGDRLRTESLEKFKKRGYKKMAIRPEELAAYKKLRELFHASRKKSA